MSKKKEGIFCSKLRADFYSLYPDDFFRKIPDAGGKGKSFSIKSPVDIYLSKNKKFYAIEAKYHDKHTAWEFGKVQQHQIEELLQVRRKNQAWVFINIKGKGVNKCACYDIARFIQIRGDFLKVNNRKSIPIDLLLLNANIILERIKFDRHTYWDWPSFFRYVKDGVK